MDENLLLQASEIEKRIQELTNNLEFIDSQILELEQFQENLNSLKQWNGKEMLSTLGKGVYLKTAMLEKELFVEVGAGIVVKKTPEETQKVVENQIKRIKEARISVLFDLDSLQKEFNNLLVEINKD